MAKKKTKATKVATKTAPVDTTPETDVQEVKTEKTYTGPSKAQQIRGNHKVRIWVIIALLILVAILFYSSLF